MQLTAREATIRDHAVRKVLPDFPAEAVKANAAGVAVAQVGIDEGGSLKSVQILEAPHPAIAQATVEAIKQWKFEFDENENTPECFNGKITFYFVIEDGKAFVKEPKGFQKT